MRACAHARGPAQACALACGPPLARAAQAPFAGRSSASLRPARTRHRTTRPLEITHPGTTMYRTEHLAPRTTPLSGASAALRHTYVSSAQGVY